MTLQSRHARTHTIHMSSRAPASVGEPLAMLPHWIPVTQGTVLLNPGSCPLPPPPFSVSQQKVARLQQPPSPSATAWGAPRGWAWLLAVQPGHKSFSTPPSPSPPSGSASSNTAVFVYFAAAGRRLGGGGSWARVGPCASSHLARSGSSTSTKDVVSPHPRLLRREAQTGCGTTSVWSSHGPAILGHFP